MKNFWETLFPLAPKRPAHEPAGLAPPVLYGERQIRPTHELVDFSALLLRWPGCDFSKITHFCSQRSNRPLQAFHLGAAEFNVKERIVYHQLRPIPDLPAFGRLKSPHEDRPASGYLKVDNDSESVRRLEPFMETYWQVTFLREHIEEYEKAHQDVFRFHFHSIPNFDPTHNQRAENYLERDLWTFDEAAARWGYGPEFLRFKLEMGHIGSSAFRPDPKAPVLGRDIREIIASKANDQITFSYGLDIEPYEQAWPAAWTYAANKTWRLGWKKDGSLAGPAPEEPTEQPPANKRGHNLAEALETKQGKLDDRWKQQTSSVLAAAVFCFTFYEKQGRPATKAEYNQHLLESGHKGLMVEADIILRKMLPPHLLNQGSDKKK